MRRTSLLLWGCESRMFHFQDRHRQRGLGIGNFRVEQLFSLLREVDDGALAAPNHCVDCTIRFARACWGSGLSVSLEESGPIIKFAEMLEHYENGRFRILMYHKNSSSEPRYNPPLTRFTPYIENLNPKRYLRVLIGGHLHRAKQIFGETNNNDRAILHALWEMIRELNAPPLCYPLQDIHDATFGFRPDWAKPFLRPTRDVLKAFIDHHRRELQG